MAVIENRPSDTDPPILTRLQVVLLVVAIVPVLTTLIVRTVNVAEDGWFGIGSIGKVGTDFAVFHTAGHLIAEGSPELLYEPAEFPVVTIVADADGRIEAYELRTDVTSASAGVLFGNPPAYAVAMAPLALLPIEIAWLLWIGLGIGALALSLRLLGLNRRILLTIVLLVSAPGWYVLFSGQGTFFWLATIAAVYAALVRGNATLAGAFAGILVLKPPLLLGFILWWVIDRRMRQALWAAGLTASAAVLLTLPFTQSTWLRYPEAVFGFASEHRYAPGLLSEYSPWGLVDLLLPGHPLQATIVGVTASILGIAALRQHCARHRGEWRLLFAGSIFATVWMSPHTLAYDWMILAAAFAALWTARPEQRKHWLNAALLLSAVCFWSAQATYVSISTLGWALQFAPLALVLVAWRIARILSASPSSPSSALSRQQKTALVGSTNRRRPVVDL